MDITLEVSDATLRSFRPETEELVEQVLADVGHKPHLSVLDIGTGFGCYS
jgi:methylase of polypeptide subunit release factors